MAGARRRASPGEARALAVARSTQFMATALELVQESGQANFTLQTLAERANLSVRTFYQHFSSKDELLLALYEDVTAQFTAAIREKVEAAEDPMGQLEAWCRGCFHARAHRRKLVAV